ncbi:MAG: hypothetical protein OEQ25_04070 [Gammaproteobacteria bacterium]|nr:hypothetical protein [Gammaproteobacteria bacterium]MDH3506297.1 hypothetical protein [Gammaproteobacteria bacterium]
MVRAVLLILAFLAVGLGPGLAHAEPLSRPGDMQWAANTPLRWEDFQGPVDPSASTERVAMTAASLSWGYAYGLERSDGHCFYRISSVDVQAIFDRQVSWVRPGHRTARILEHEQGHFDLTQLFKLKLDDLAGELVGIRRTCKGDSVAVASDFTERDAARAVSGLAEKVWQEHVAAQEAYDEQTRHGILTDVQHMWTETIRRGLREARWDSLEDLL